MKVKFTIPGEPKGKGRPRFSNGRATTPEATASYENLIQLYYIQQCGRHPFEKDVPLDVRIVGYYSIPESASKKKKAMMAAHLLRPIKKPDADNVAKIAMDALNKLVQLWLMLTYNSQFIRYIPSKWASNASCPF